MAPAPSRRVTCWGAARCWRRCVVAGRSPVRGAWRGGGMLRVVEVEVSRHAVQREARGDVVKREQGDDRDGDDGKPARAEGVEVFQRLAVVGAQEAAQGEEHATVGERANQCAEQEGGGWDAG